MYVCLECWMVCVVIYLKFVNFMFSVPAFLPLFCTCSASVMSAPAALAISKMLYPEVAHNKSKQHDNLHDDNDFTHDDHHNSNDYKAEGNNHDNNDNNYDDNYDDSHNSEKVINTKKAEGETEAEETIGEENNDAVEKQHIRKHRQRISSLPYVKGREEEDEITNSDPATHTTTTTNTSSTSIAIPSTPSNATTIPTAPNRTLKFSTESMHANGVCLL